MLKKLKTVIILGMTVIVALTNAVQISASKEYKINTVITVDGSQTFAPKKDTIYSNKGNHLRLHYVDGYLGFCMEPTQYLREDAKYMSRPYNANTDRELSKIKWLGYERYMDDRYSNYGEANSAKAFHFSLTQLAIWKYLKPSSIEYTDWDTYSNRDYPYEVNMLDYEIKMWDKWPDYIEKTIILKPGHEIVLDGYLNGKHIINHSDGIDVTEIDSKDHPTNINDEKVIRKNNYFKQLKITAKPNAIGDKMIYLSEFNNNQYNKVQGKDPLVLTAENSQDFIFTNGFIHPTLKFIKIRIAENDSLVIKKYDEKGNPVKDAVFEVSNSSDFNNILYTVKTKEDGNCDKIDGINLDYKKLFIREKSVPKRIVLSNEVKEVVLDGSNNHDITFKDKIVKGKIKIKKAHETWGDYNNYIANENLVYEQGIKFGIYNKNNELVQEVVTDDKGEALTNLLEYGSYNVVPIKKSRDAKNSPVSVNIEDNDKVYDVSFIDKIKTSKVNIQTIDNNTNNIIKDNNIVYELFDESRNNKITINGIGQFKSKNDGNVVLNGELPEGKYSIKQVNAPKNYLINKEFVDFTLNGIDKDVTIKVFNKKNNGKVIVHNSLEYIKSYEVVDKLGYKINKPEYSYKDANNVEFSIYDEKDNLIGNFKTNDNGIIEVNLNDGKYILRQKKINNYTSLPDIKFTIDSVNTPINKLDLNNRIDTKKLKFKINFEDPKYHEIYKNKAIDNILFGIYKKSKGNEDLLLDVKKIDKDFIINVDSKIDDDIYIKQLNDTNEYRLNENKIIYSSSTNENTLNIDLKKGSISIYKFDADSKEPIKNAEFGLRLKDTKNILIKLKTDEKGKLNFENIELGRYEVVELSNPGYIFNDVIVDSYLSKDNENKKFDITNKKVIENVNKDNKNSSDKKDDNKKNNKDNKDTNIDSNKDISSNFIENNKEINNIIVLTKASYYNKDGKFYIKDEYNYKGLEVGCEYVISGKIIDKSNGKEISINNNPIIKEIRFIPNSTDGRVMVEFDAIDSDLINNKEVVIVEKLYKKGVVVNSHNDLDDRNQTIKLTDEKLPVTSVGTTVYFALFGMILSFAGAIVIIRRK